jgi:hypothetical protein
VTFNELLTVAAGAVQGIGVGSGFLLVLFIGICVLIGFWKLRPSGPRTLTVRSLEEALGAGERYLPPSAPRGRVDQLRGSQRPV